MENFDDRYVNHNHDPDDRRHPPARGREPAHLTHEQLAILRRYGEMTEEEYASQMRLIEHEPDISKYFGKRKAFALVFGSLQKAVSWFAAFVGALWLGFDKIKAVITFFVDMIKTTL